MTNLSDAFTPEQRKANKAKIVDNNTFRYTSENGDTVYRLAQHRCSASAGARRRGSKLRRLQDRDDEGSH
jgi:hypothetical protein